MLNKPQVRSDLVNLDGPPPNPHTPSGAPRPSLSGLTRREEAGPPERGQAGLPALGDLQAQGLALQLGNGASEVLKKLAELLPTSGNEFLQIRQQLVAAVRKAIANGNSQGPTGGAGL